MTALTFDQQIPLELRDGIESVCGHRARRTGKISSTEHEATNAHAPSANVLTVVLTAAASLAIEAETDAGEILIMNPVTSFSWCGLRCLTFALGS